jgi:membrane protease subunit HflC
MSLRTRSHSFKLSLRVTCALGAVLAAGAASALMMVGPGQAMVVTQFGRPVRVLTQPGLAWKIPAPIQQTIPVDLRMRTTSSGLQDVGTKEGLRILVQAYVAWEVDDDPAHIEQFLRAGRNDENDIAERLRSLLGSTLQVTASNFNLSDLINTHPDQSRFAGFEEQLQANLYQQVLDTYGIRIVQTAVERLSLPAETLAATVARMRAERETVAALRTADGLRAASAIRSDAERDARLIAAKAQQEVAEIEAKGREQASQIHASAYALDPQLYTMVRSLDTLGATLGPKTRVILRTDAEPFRALVQGPPGTSPGASTASPPPAATTGDAPPALSDWRVSGDDPRPVR